MNIRTVDRKLLQLSKQDMTAKDAGRQARNAYNRAWRAKNRDKVRQYNESYWARKAAQNGEEATEERC
jgi:hypothetical protein